jgi:hydrogenase nickel incorporation protein HypA/HybF
MHELGIVFHCIKQINSIAEENKVKRVNSVTVEIGEVSAVIPYYFEDCWNWAVKRESILKDAKIIIEKIDAVTHCENCGENYPTVKHGKICPHCGSPNTYLLCGNEISIKQIEVVDT